MNLFALRTILDQHRWALPTLVALGFVASLMEGLGIGLLIPVLQTVLDEQTSELAGPFVGWMDRYAAMFDAENRLLLLGVSIFLLVVLKTGLTFAHVYMSEWLDGSVVHDLRTRLARQLLDVEYTYLLRQRPGRLLDTFQNQALRAGDVFSRVSRLIIAGANVVVFVALLVLTSWRVTLMVGAGVIVISLALGFLIRRARRLGQETVGASQRLVDRTVELLDGMRVIRAFGQEGREFQRFRDASDRHRRAHLATDVTAFMVEPFMELLFVPLLLIALLVAWRAGTSISVLLASLVLLYRVLPKIRQFQTARVRLASLVGSIEEVTNLLRTDDKPFLPQGRLAFTGLGQGLRFEDVSFRYGPRAGETSAGGVKPEVRGLTFEVERGSMLGVVGGSGAGKSTLVNLLCRFYDPQQGRILVDGTPLPEFTLDSWRGKIAIAGQDAELFGGTFADNIAYASPDADRVAIERAARRAEAHEFISAMPRGYDTEIGPRGGSLSAGQRQRIGLARALLAEPDLLILDEATNALDNATAAVIGRSVEALRGELTIILIAHRLEAVRGADHILVLAGGEIVEQGAPDALHAQGGEFAQLHAHEPRDGSLGG